MLRRAPVPRHAYFQGTLPHLPPCRSRLLTAAQIRSLTLDKWDPYAIEIVKQLGNKKSNHYWEYQIPPNHHKPTPDSKNPVKQLWIVSKYKDKLFTPRVTTPVRIHLLAYCHPA